MIPIKVNPECVGCGQCVQQCPSRCLMIKNGKRVYISSENCALCGHCFAICPVGAIEILGQTADQLKVDLQHLNDIENIIAYRRSIRKYEQTPINPEALDEILQFLKYRPTQATERPNILLLNRSAMEDVGNIIAHEMKEQFPKLPQQQLALDVVFRGASHCVIIFVGAEDFEEQGDDGVIALTQLELLAQSKGLGTFWAGMLKDQGNLSTGVKQRLGLLPTDIITGCIALGTPAIKYRRSVGRMPYHVDDIE